MGSDDDARPTRTAAPPTPPAATLTDLPTTAFGTEPLAPVTDLLPAAEAELLVISDTHLVDARTPHAREFSSRLRQNERISAALRVVAGCPAMPVVHLGDLVQDYPENPTHQGLLELAVRQVRAAASEVWFAAGNTDVGDKPDPSSPAAPADQQSLERWDGAIGGGWTSFRRGEVHGIVLTASLFNSGLAAEQQQWEWFEQELSHSTAHWRLLFWHYPTYWRDPDDPGPGNYDVIDEPARSRLLALATRHDVSAVFTGHSHFAFLNRHHDIRLYGVPSTSFTRPGFSELFSGPAPAGHGRDDIAKLGLHLVRLHRESPAGTAQLRVHPLRTGPLTERLKRTPGARPVLTATPGDVPGATLGVIARHPISTVAEVPDVFPSVRRAPVRNDHPLLACLALGAGQVSVAPEDLTDPVRAERVALLRAEGVAVTVRVLWPSGTDPLLPQGWPVDGEASVDAVELMLLDRAAPTPADRAWLETFAATGSPVPLHLGTLMRTRSGTAELPRWRYGFTWPEVAALPLLPGITRLLVSSSARPHGSDDAEPIRPTEATLPVTLVHPLRPDEPLADLVEAFVESRRAGHRFLVDGLDELDRTLDVRPGLVDRIGNPTPAHHALAVLNPTLHGPVDITREADRYTVHRAGRRFVIDLRRTDEPPPRDAPAEVVDLADAMTSRPEECSGPWLEWSSDRHRGVRPRC